MADPRLSIISKRLEKISRIVAISSGKGGVGKSMVSSTLALLLANRGFKVGLFDLDFTSPSTHVILGIEGIQPEENMGIVPPTVHGLQYMSIVYYTREHATPLRGADLSNGLIELLAVTKWEKLDILILDMPPGIGDATLDLIRLIKRIEFVVVTTPSQLAFATVRKLSSLLKELKIPLLGVIENMKMKSSTTIQQQADNLDLAYLGAVDFDMQLEEAIGSVAKLLATDFAESMGEVVTKLNL